MTTAQLSHLRAIDAHLAKLLNIAAKRTPGEWDSMGIAHSNCLRLFSGNNYLGAIGNSDAERDTIQDDTAFITSCAGNAEAGWKATRSTIDWLIHMHKHGEGWRNVGLVDDILAAFPLELIEA